MTARLGLTMLKKGLEMAINSDVSKYLLKYDVLKQLIVFEVHLSENDIRNYPFDGEQKTMVCKTIDDLIKEHIKQGDEVHHVHINHEEIPNEVDKIEVIIYYVKDGKKLQNNLEL